MKSSHGIYINKTGKVAYRIDWVNSEDFISSLFKGVDVKYMGVSITLMSDSGLAILEGTLLHYRHIRASKLIHCELYRRMNGSLPDFATKLCAEYYRNVELDDFQVTFELRKEYKN